MEFLLEERKGNQGIAQRERVDTHNWFEALVARDQNKSDSNKSTYKSKSSQASGA